MLSLVDMVANFPVKMSKLSCSFIYLRLVYLIVPEITENMGLYDVQATDVVAHIVSGKCGKNNTSAAIVVICMCFVICNFFCFLSQIVILRCIVLTLMNYTGK